MPESDKSLPENSKENLDRKLDHAVKETFPTSDPVSITITKGGAVDYDENGKPVSTEQEQQGRTSETLVAVAGEKLDAAVSAASGMARGAYEQGRRYARRAAERYPEADRLYRQGSRAVRDHAPENPLVVALLGAVAGYGIAWMIHHRTRREDELPEYAYTRRDYPFAK